MEHLRLFENYKSDVEIHEICEKYHIKNYTINKDGSVDVNGDVNISDMNLTELPLTFNNVRGTFGCSGNKLKSLKGSPRIVGENFWGNGNDIVNLIGGPDEVSGHYAVHSNFKLKSLKGVANIIGINLDIRSCHKIVDFKGIPEDFYAKSIYFMDTAVYHKLEKFLRKKYNIRLENIGDKYLDLILAINELDAIQNGKIIEFIMDEVLYNINLI